MKGFQLDQFMALEITKGFWKGLELSLDAGILDHVLVQMPPEMRDIFSTRTPVIESIQMEFGYALS